MNIALDNKDKHYKVLLKCVSLKPPISDSKIYTKIDQCVALAIEEIGGSCGL